jgi:hypothetical protein
MPDKEETKDVTDNRMQCITYLKDLEEYEVPADNFFVGYATEYEYFSDSRICGLFTIGEKHPITFRMVESEQNEFGYYRYLLHIPTIINPTLLGKMTNEEYSAKVLNNFDEAREDGYYFKEGLAGELICIFAVCLRARFYLRNQVNRDSKGVSTKMTYPVFLPSTVSEYKSIFDDKKKNLTSDVIPFFQKVANLPDKGHFNIIHAFREYHEALKNIGIDHDIAYLKFVVAIEGIASIEKGKSSFEEDFPECIDVLDADQERLSQISKMWENRGSFKSVLSFFEKYLLQDKAEFAETLCMNEKGENQTIPLKKTVDRIYDARSKYVHEGLQMLISRSSFDGSAYEPTLGGVRDRKKISIDELLPLISYFDLMVNNSLIAYIEKNTVV